MTAKQKQKLLKRLFTVGDLKKMLADVPDSLPIGVSGYFGEFKPMDRGDFSLDLAHLVPIGEGWREMEQEPTKIFSITSPELGPCPD